MGAFNILRSQMRIPDSSSAVTYEDKEHINICSRRLDRQRKQVKKPRN